METRAPCFERLQVIDDPVPRAGATNMALDEALLGSLTGIPVLRMYDWARPVVSFGYFETADAARKVARGGEVVRRWTGGGIVEHGDDQTYSLIVPRSCAFATLGSAETYRRIHAALAAALAEVGFSAHSHEGNPIPLGDNLCFDRPVLHDLMVEGRKTAGAAQRRNRVGLLHQGSIRLPGGEQSVRARWKERLRQALPHALADECDDRSFSAGEIARANDLAHAKYETAAWAEKF